MEYKQINHYLILNIDESFHHMQIEQFFKTFYLSKKQIHELRMSQDVFLNHKSVAQNFQIILQKGDQLMFPFFIDETPDFIPEDIPIDIVYEDEFLLVVNKPAGMLVHPSEKDGKGTLVNGISHYYQQTNQQRRIRYIHRLDTETSGLLVLAKTAFIHSYYDHLLKEKKIKRLYYAIVEGKPKKSVDTIHASIGRDRHHNSRRIISKTGDDAITHYQILQSNKRYSLLQCQLETGRTHQIRVHLRSIGHPIVGDHLYNPKKHHIKRHALHAYQLQLFHPFKQNNFIITIELPKELAILLD